MDLRFCWRNIAGSSFRNSNWRGPGHSSRLPSELDASRFCLSPAGAALFSRVSIGLIKRSFLLLCQSSRPARILPGREERGVRVPCGPARPCFSSHDPTSCYFVKKCSKYRSLWRKILSFFEKVLEAPGIIVSRGCRATLAHCAGQRHAEPTPNPALTEEKTYTVFAVLSRGHCLLSCRRTSHRRPQKCTPLVQARVLLLPQR